MRFRSTVLLNWLLLNTLFLVLLIASSAVTAEPQQSAASYERADGLRSLTRNKVFRDQIRAHWFAEGTKLWYRIEIAPDTHRFILVDAEAGERREAFDHARLAQSLSKAIGETVNPGSLDLQELTFDESAKKAEFFFAGKKWECSLKSYQLEEQVDSAGDGDAQETTVHILPRARPARRSGGETGVLFLNRLEEPVSIQWVNDVDDPTPYATVQPGQRHRQHTYQGHVWLARTESGKTVGVYEAVRSDGVAVIDGSWRPGQRRRAEESGKNEQKSRRRRAGGVSPDGKWRARIENHNVVVRNLETEKEMQLSDNGSEADPYQGRFYWSPDSEKLVVTQEKKAKRRRVHVIESAPDDQLQPKLHTYTYTKPGDEIDHPRPRLFHVSKGERVDIPGELFSNPWRLSRFRWSPDSSRFTFLYNQRGHQVLRVVSVDARSGSPRTLIEESSDTFICYSSKLFLRQLDASNEIIWMSERDGWNHLYLFDAATGKLKNQITSGEWVVREVERVDEEKRQIWFTAGGIHAEQDPYHVHYCRVNFDGTGLVALTEGDGTHEIEFSPDRRYFVDRFSRVDLPPVHQLRRSVDGKLICDLEQADWTRLLETGWQVPERFVAKGRDGETDIYGVIYRPTDFDPGKKYPVIEKIYAGPQSAHVPKRFSSYHGAQAMAELGFILVQIDGMGTSHRSKAFHDVCYQDLADAGFPDRIRWIKAAGATRPWMDLSRVGIYGGSAGGQNAMRAVIDHGDFYDAAAADCGCHDNRMDKIWWNEQWMGWPLGPHYAESSNVEHAHRLSGHLMLLVGELDRNVDPASTMQVVDALIEADKDFELVYIPGAGHGAGGGSYGRRRQRDFFMRHLKGIEPRTGNGNGTAAVSE